MPAWNSPRSRATGTPHPGRGSVGCPKAACKAGVSGMEHPEPSTEKGAMAMPPPVVQGGPLHRAAETLEEEVKKAPRECGTRWTVGRRTEP